MLWSFLSIKYNSLTLLNTKLCIFYPAQPHQLVIPQSQLLNNVCWDLSLPPQEQCWKGCGCFKLNTLIHWGLEAGGSFRVLTFYNNTILLNSTLCMYLCMHPSIHPSLYLSISISIYTHSIQGKFVCPSVTINSFGVKLWQFDHIYMKTTR